MNKIMVLGQEYKIKECTTETYPKLESLSAAGLCEYHSKEIILDKDQYTNPHHTTLERVDLWKNRLLRHEIIHAFCHESGAARFRDDEELTDWLAIQIPKMASLFNKLGILMD